MSYTPISGPGLTLALIRDTLAAIPAWLAIAPTPLDRIVVGDAGPDPRQFVACSEVAAALAPPLAIIELIELEDQLQALDDSERTGSASLDLFLAPVADDPSSGYLRAVDQVAAILNGFEAANRAGTCRVRARLTSPPRLTPGGAPIPNVFHSSITLSWMIP